MISFTNTCSSPFQAGPAPYRSCDEGRVARLSVDRDRPLSRATLRDGQVEGQLRLIGGEEALQSAVMGSRVGAGDVEWQAVAEETGGPAQDQRSLGQGLAIDLEVCEAPGKGRERGDPELGRVLQEAVLYLEMLRCEENTFAPEHTLGLTHR